MSAVLAVVTAPLAVVTAEFAVVTALLAFVDAVLAVLTAAVGKAARFMKGATLHPGHHTLSDCGSGMTQII